MKPTICSGCGKYVEEGARYCISCGLATKVSEKNDAEIKKDEFNSQRIDDKVNNQNVDNVNDSSPDKDDISYINQLRPPRDNKGVTKLFIGIGIAVFVFLIISVIIFISSSNSGSNNSGKYSQGVMTDSTYYSSFIGVEYNTPDGWINDTDNALFANNGQDNVMWELMTADSESGNNIIIGVETLASDDITTYTYLDSIKSSLEESGEYTIENTLTESGKYVAGQKYDTLSVNAKKMGVGFFQRFYVRKVGRYMISFSVTSFDGTDPATMLNEFKQLSD